MPGECAFSYIGTIRSPHKAVVGMPIQSPGAAALVGRPKGSTGPERRVPYVRRLSIGQNI